MTVPAFDPLRVEHLPLLSRWLAEPLVAAGFVRLAEGELTPDNPAHSRDHVIYAISRPVPASA